MVLHIGPEGHLGNVSGSFGGTETRSYKTETCRRGQACTEVKSFIPFDGSRVYRRRRHHHYHLTDPGCRRGCSLTETGLTT
jgi:hypothetical protein